MERHYFPRVFCMSCYFWSNMSMVFFMFFSHPNPPKKSHGNPRCLSEGPLVDPTAAALRRNGRLAGPQGVDHGHRDGSVDPSRLHQRCRGFLGGKFMENEWREIENQRKPGGKWRLTIYIYICVYIMYIFSS